MRWERALWVIPLIGSASFAAQACGEDGEESPGGAAPFCEKAPAGSEHNAEVGCDQRCPGDPGCKPSGDATLYAGAAVEDITPVVDHVVAFAPSSTKKHEFNPFAGDKCVKKGSCDLGDVNTCTAVDPMKCTWIAGFGAGRPAAGNADPTSVRCAVLARGNTKIGLCSVDAVGWFYNEIEATRELIAKDHPDLDLDFLAVAATHVHETQDTMGIWGPSDTESGVKPEFNAMIRQKTAAALAKANAALRPVQLQLGASKVDGHIAGTDPGGHGTAAFVSDTRDPVVIDNELRVMRFVATDDQSTVATLINFTSHPEFADDQNVMTSADYVHTLREGVEQGLDVKDGAGKSLVKTPGFGGVAIFFNGPLGGQVGPGKVNHTDFEGNPVPEGLERAYNNGRLLAVYAHEALTKGVETLETAAIGFRAREIYVDILNTAYHIALAQQLFQREGYFFDKYKELGEDNVPALRTQIAVIDIGPAELIGLPAELHAELLLATPDGKSALDAPYPFTPKPFFVLNDKATNPSCGTDGYSRCDDGPPAIDQMDREKIIDLARDPRAKYRWALGLMQDEIGYIVPDYDYKLDPQNPYLEEASPGEHYEETNSVGKNVQSHIVDPILQLLRSPPVIRR
jgi:hypothetical protein